MYKVIDSHYDSLINSNRYKSNEDNLFISIIDSNEDNVSKLYTNASVDYKLVDNNNTKVSFLNLALMYSSKEVVLKLLNSDNSNTINDFTLMKSIERGDLDIIKILTNSNKDKFKSQLSKLVNHSIESSSREVFDYFLDYLKKDENITLNKIIEYITYSFQENQNYSKDLFELYVSKLQTSYINDIKNSHIKLLTSLSKAHNSININTIKIILDELMSSDYFLEYIDSDKSDDSIVDLFQNLIEHKEYDNFFTVFDKFNEYTGFISKYTTKLSNLVFYDKDISIEDFRRYNTYDVVIPYDTTKDLFDYDRKSTTDQSLYKKKVEVLITLGELSFIKFAIKNGYDLSEFKDPMLNHLKETQDQINSNKKNDINDSKSYNLAVYYKEYVKIIKELGFISQKKQITKDKDVDTEKQLITSCCQNSLL